MNNPFEVIDARLVNIENLLIDLKHTPRAEEKKESDQWFDLRELCEYHPDKPTKGTVYGWVHLGLIPCHKGSKKLRFLKSEIDDWIKSGRKKTLKDAAAEADAYLKKKGAKV